MVAGNRVHQGMTGTWLNGNVSRCIYGREILQLFCDRRGPVPGRFRGELENSFAAEVLAGGPLKPIRGAHIRRFR
jgi:hypothetical protein